MTVAALLFLAAIVAVFVFFMGLLGYGLIVAGDSGEAAKAGSTGTAGAAAAARQAVRQPVRKAGKATGRKAPALEDAA